MWLRVCQKKIPRGAFNILPRESIEYSRNLPRGSIHHDTPAAFQQIFILSDYRTSKGSNQNHHLNIESIQNQAVIQ